MTLIKIISGGQTGVDEAGLRAAKFCGLATWGEIPKGFRTLDGPRPDLALEYGLTESISSGYPLRTENNVKNADATIRFASNFHSPGEKCTLRAIKWFKKQYLDININNPLSIEIVSDWIVDGKFKILNIAGNSEDSSPGIGKFVEDFLKEVFVKVKMKEMNQNVCLDNQNPIS